MDASPALESDNEMRKNRNDAVTDFNNSKAIEYSSDRDIKDQNGLRSSSPNFISITSDTSAPSELGYFDDMFAGIKKKSNRALFTNLIHVLRRTTFVLIAMCFDELYWV